MPDIPFILYLRPDGRKRAVTIDRPAPIWEKAKAIIEAGYVFECEELTTGHVSFTIADDEKDHAIQLAENGPLVPATVDTLVEEGYAKLCGDPGPIQGTIYRSPGEKDEVGRQGYEWSKKDPPC